MTKPYRRGVIGVVINDAGQVLVCERSDKKGVYQFAQGGIEDGETPREALFRELKEELGTADFIVLKQAPQQTCYDFPADANFAIAKSYCGQIHDWFLLKLKPNAVIDLDRSDGEFCSYQWIQPDEVLTTIIDWKHEAYKQGLKNLGLIS